MGTRSRVDFNDRCTDRGPVKLDRILAGGDVLIFANPRYHNRAARLAARSRIRRAVKWIAKHTAPKERTAVQRGLLDHYGYLLHKGIA